MENKECYEELCKILNEFLDNGGELCMLSEYLEKYGKDENTVFTFDESIDYTKFFLNLYYDICRTVGRQEAMSMEGEADEDWEDLMYCFIGFLVVKDLYEEYGTEGLEQEEYENYIKKYDLK